MQSRIDYKHIDQKWQNYWEENNIFHSEPNDKPAFSMILPPPNSTGIIHIGHALNNTFSDTLCRYKRMMGYNVCWVPGIDHAGIATQVKVEQFLKQQGIDKNKLSKEEFLKYIWDWKGKYGGIIINQLKKLGISCDWQREKFTLDNEFCDHVKKTFVKMYKDNLIYQGDYICNWCPILKTVISDEEVKDIPIKGKLYFIKYKLENSEDFLTIATSRPESIFGDVAVAFNPNDERYQKYKGQNVLIPIINKKIPLIDDHYVKMDFGSGLVKITPAHDKNDFEVGIRHNLPRVNIFDSECKLTNTNTKYDGMDRETARRFIVRDLKENNLLEKIDEYETSIKKCDRSQSIIEPMLSKQWFVKMKPLAEIAKNMIKNIYMTPEKNINIFNHWIENIRDWCISRQLVWGHQIPIWYCNSCNNVMCELEVPTSCSQCSCNDLRQDPDVLDTWFSSMLCPFGDFSDKELDYYFPTNALITGEDILFFWVIKMIMASGYIHNKEPFKAVYLHGIVRDENRQKMAKSLGNIIDPLQIIDKYGTDPLRFSLIMNTPKDRDANISEKSIEIGKTFCTKYWNVVRYCLMNIDINSFDINTSNLSQEDFDIIQELNNLTQFTHKLYNEFEFNHICQKLYHFVWDKFANTYLEFCKKNMFNDRKVVLIKIICTLNKLLHPLIPHITEEIWEILNKQYNISSKILSLEDYPIHLVM